MKNQITLLAALLSASGAVSAETSLLEAVGKQMAKDAATAAAPEVVKEAEAANRTLESAKQLKESVENAPAALKTQAKEAAKEKLRQATPEELKQGAETLKKAKQLKANAPSADEAVKAAKHKAKQKAAEKVLDLLQ